MFKSLKIIYIKRCVKDNIIHSNSKQIQTFVCNIGSRLKKYLISEKKLIRIA
jgi:hypothetical protein